MITFTLNVAVPALSDKSVWFANAQAWNNYWSNVSAEATLDPIETTVYAPVAFNPTGPDNQEIDGVLHELALHSDLLLLAAKVSAMDTELQLMRQQMKDAGLITEAQ